MRFLVDAQLPPSLARFLTTVGEEAIACRDVGLRDADDGEIWRFAIAGGWCIVTKDEDFAVRHMMAVVLLQIPVADEVVGLTYSCPNMPATMFTSQPASVPAGFPSAITRG